MDNWSAKYISTCDQCNKPKKTSFLKDRYDNETEYICADCLVEDMDDEQIAALKKAIGRREEENGLRSPE